MRLVGVQAAGAAAYPASLVAGHPVPLESMATIADGIAVGCPGELTYRMVRELVDDVVTVSEESLSQALLLCLERAKLVVEPAGAAAVAALMDAPRTFEPPVVAVLSGGNIDPVLLLRAGLGWLANFTSWARRLLDRLRAFWARLWGGKRAGAQAAGEARPPP